MTRFSLAQADDPVPSPQIWLWSAERLLYGGQLLWDAAVNSWPPKADQRVHAVAAGQFGTAFLLFGYAFENAIKGLITQHLEAAGQPVRRENGRLVGIPTNGHSLRKWATNNAGISLADDEGSLLDRLGEYVLWAGRYPVMKVAMDLRPGQIVPNTYMHPETDRPLVDALFEKIAEHYDARSVRLTGPRSIF